MTRMRGQHHQNIHTNQGIGGKVNDHTFETISEFEKSKTYYFGLGKKTSKNKSREGNDYFATPEPLGLKMVEWLNLQPGNKALEPSAGHGAIARFFPENTENTFIESSYSLSSKLSMNAKGTIKTIRFEEFSKWNKFDAIAMNPPFGRSGKMAAGHLEKAIVHLSNYGTSRLAIIVPNGSSMHKRLDKIYNDEIFENIQLIAEIILPSVVFERAGTKVWTKVLIFEKNSDVLTTRKIDYSHISSINSFFDEIEDITI